MATTWNEDGSKKERTNKNRGHVASGKVIKIPPVSILEQLKSGKELDQKVKAKKYGWYES